MGRDCTRPIRGELSAFVHPQYLAHHLRHNRQAAMQRIVIHRPGGYDRLRLETHPTPDPGPGEVRVRVAACGVNYADIVVRRGLYASAKHYVGWPITPGFEFAGSVDAVGDGVTDGGRRRGGARRHPLRRLRHSRDRAGPPGVPTPGRR